MSSLQQNPILGDVSMRETSGNYEDVTQEHAICKYTVSRKDGTVIREGPELTSTAVETIPFGAVIEVFENSTVTNKEGIARMRVRLTSGKEGWTSLKTRDGDAVLEKLGAPYMDKVERLTNYRVVHSNGTKIREGIELDSLVIKDCSCGDVVNVVENSNCFTADGIERVQVRLHTDLCGWTSLKMRNGDCLIQKESTKGSWALCGINYCPLLIPAIMLFIAALSLIIVGSIYNSTYFDLLVCVKSSGCSVGPDDTTGGEKVSSVLYSDICDDECGDDCWFGTGEFICDAGWGNFVGTNDCSSTTIYCFIYRTGDPDTEDATTAFNNAYDKYEQIVIGTLVPGCLTMVLSVALFALIGWLNRQSILWRCSKLF